MPTVTITTNYDGHAYYVEAQNTYSKNDTNTYIDVGYEGKSGGKYRGFLRFPLSALPAGAQITQVRLYVYCTTAGGSDHLLDVHAYGTNGQEDPQPDDAATCYNRCASGNLYYDDGTDLRTTGSKWIVLGGSIIQDIINAKNAVNRFALGLHEEGDDTSVAVLDTLEKSGGYPAQLEITYTVPVVAKIAYTDGFVCVLTAMLRRFPSKPQPKCFPNPSFQGKCSGFRRQPRLRPSSSWQPHL